MPVGSFVQAMERIGSVAGHIDLVIVALSGGMDSVTALHLTADWARYVNRPLLAAHVNHGLRGNEADGDEEFCRELCQKKGIDFISARFDVSREASTLRLGLEETGRLLRYRFFLEETGRKNCTAPLVITGHHADDQAETILLNLRRGAHRRGLCGMREYSVLPVPPGGVIPVARPLLTVDRETLVQYAASHNLQWREDATNNDTAFLRNRIRHRILPGLERLMPGFRQRLITSARRRSATEEEYTEAGRILSERWCSKEHQGRFFKTSPQILDDPEILLYAFRHIIEDELGRRIPYRSILLGIAELARDGRLGQALSLPGRLVVRREQDGLFFHYPHQVENETEHVLPDPPFTSQFGPLIVTAEWRPCSGLPPVDDRQDAMVEWLDPSSIRWPLYLRPPRPGERFRPLGSPGSRKIHDLLVDMKTPRRKRGMSRVVADNAGPLWIWPYRLAHRVRLGGTTTQALRLHIIESSSSE